MSLRGYCRTLSVFIACSPAIRMTKLITIARTGRRMKRSVNDFIVILHHVDLPQSGERTRLACIFRRPRRNTLWRKISRWRGRHRQHARARALPRSPLRRSFSCHSSFVLRHSSHESTGVGAIWGLGAKSLLIVTAMPLRNLKTPVPTIVSPAFNPVVTETKSPRASPMRINC